MAGIIGITGINQSKTAHDMLSKISHRGKNHNVLMLKDGLTIGVASNNLDTFCTDIKNTSFFRLSNREDSTSVALQNKSVILRRDKYGVEPLYYTFIDNDNIAFASEIKALFEFGTVIHELEPGYILENRELTKYFELKKNEPMKMEQREISQLLRETLTLAIKNRLGNTKIGAWLSGGLDSSAISALLRPNVEELYTFSVGFRDAEDLKYAKIVADHIRSNHHERIISFEDIVKVLPDVIYHLESFDALLVRSSIMNYLVSQSASEYVDEVFSGEGGDELFAGYHYIKELPADKIEDELIDITKRLHNTALQRVDRCSSAFGTVAHVPFVDSDVVDFAVRVPVEQKLYKKTEKWILRLALADYLPTEVLLRAKSKFWEGSGIGQHFYSYATGLISDSDFQNEKTIKCGWELNSKEELMYYRIFKEHFGEMENLDWMGRTKGVAPSMK